MSKIKARIFSIGLISAILFIFLYLIARILLFILSDLHWEEIVIGGLLFLAESFIMCCGFGYFLNVFRVLHSKNSPHAMKHQKIELIKYPPVAIVVASYKEPLDILEDTLTCFYNLTYPNKHLYFLDDTRYDRVTPELVEYRSKIEELCERIGVNLFRRPWRRAKAGMINDFLKFLAGHPVPETKCMPYGTQPDNGPTYIILFDADMNPFPNFVEPLVEFMEKHPRTAFFQTPQYYSNLESNRVANAACLQQAVFYEYICEGKSTQDAIFCCGTNVILRREALEDVNGFDERFVTEDFATSFQFHIHGWHSSYLNKICACGLGPEDIRGYFRQQFRWALGTVCEMYPIVRTLFHEPSRLRPSQWWEYFLSATFYFVGWMFLIMAICPVLYLFWDITSISVSSKLYFLFFLPYIICTMTIFLYSMIQRKYRIRDLAWGILLQAISFPIHILATFLAVIGVHGTFTITPKGSSSSLPLWYFWPQLGLALFCLAAFTWGVLRLWHGDGPPLAIAINVLWCLYNFVLLSSLLYFNFPDEAS